VNHEWLRILFSWYGCWSLSSKPNDVV